MGPQCPFKIPRPRTNSSEHSTTYSTGLLAKIIMLYLLVRYSNKKVFFYEKSLQPLKI